jgi:hypothetical protein
MYVPRRIGTAPRWPQLAPRVGPLLLGDRRQKQATLTQMLVAAADRQPTSESRRTLSRHSSEAAASARPRAEAVSLPSEITPVMACSTPMKVVLRHAPATSCCSLDLFATPKPNNVPEKFDVVRVEHAVRSRDLSIEMPRINK